MTDHPVPEYGEGATISTPGMSMRDYFAGQALLKLSGAVEDQARNAYAMADAMIAERNKGR